MANPFPIEKLEKRIEELSYYTPSIEDIRVGYEFDILETESKILRSNDKYFRQEWKHHIIDEDYSLELIAADIEIHNVRTKYLTKQQIEGEGWNILKKSDNNYIHADRKGSYYEHLLRYDMAHQTLAIYNNIDSALETLRIPAFYGNCPSINEFRYISKLIGI